MYYVTVIIPTFKEEANIGRIISEVDTVFKQHAINGEILVVDDNSPDGTIAIVNEQKKTRPNLNLIVRQSDHGLSQSVADGFVHASSDIFVVMDADLSHPPALIPTIVSEIRAGYDVVIGSRYMEGGGIKKWSLKQRIRSISGTFFGRLLFPDISDPVSGFFGMKKSVVANASLKPRNYKILLEVLGKGTWVKDKEIPFEFVDRESDSSKLRLKTIIEYAQQVIDIALFSISHHESAAWKEWKRVFRFGLVGLSGIFVNMGVLKLLLMVNISEYIALFFAIVLSILNNFLWNDVWTFKASPQKKVTSIRQRLCSFCTISAGGAIINYSITILLKQLLGINIYISDLIGILIGFSWNFLINRRFTWGRR
jgi:dolichol-phosphate mannosyltransferase